MKLDKVGKLLKGGAGSDPIGILRRPGEAARRDRGRPGARTAPPWFWGTAPAVARLVRPRFARRSRRRFVWTRKSAWHSNHRLPWLLPDRAERPGSPGRDAIRACEARERAVHRGCRAFRQGPEKPHVQGRTEKELRRGYGCAVLQAADATAKRPERVRGPAADSRTTSQSTGTRRWPRLFSR